MRTQIDATAADVIAINKLLPAIDTSIQGIEKLLPAIDTKLDQTLQGVQQSYILIFRTPF
jgi:hypothetical protein